MSTFVRLNSCDVGLLRLWVHKCITTFFSSISPWIIHFTHNYTYCSFILQRQTACSCFCVPASLLCFTELCSSLMKSTAGLRTAASLLDAHLREGGSLHVTNTFCTTESSFWISTHSWISHRRRSAVLELHQIHLHAIMFRFETQELTSFSKLNATINEPINKTDVEKWIWYNSAKLIVFHLQNELKMIFFPLIQLKHIVLYNYGYIKCQGIKFLPVISYIVIGIFITFSTLSTFSALSTFSIVSTFTAFSAFNTFCTVSTFSTFSNFSAFSAFSTFRFSSIFSIFSTLSTLSTFKIFNTFSTFSIFSTSSIFSNFST